QIEEHHRAMLELAADDAFRRPAESVAIKGQRTLEAIDAEGDDADARLHAVPPCGGRACAAPGHPPLRPARPDSAALQLPRLRMHHALQRAALAVVQRRR